MDNRFEALAQGIFKKQLAQVSEDELKGVLQQYPYFTPAHFLFLKKLKAGSDVYKEEFQKAILYHHNPFAFDEFLHTGDYFTEPSNQNTPQVDSSGRPMYGMQSADLNVSAQPEYKTPGTGFEEKNATATNEQTGLNAVPPVKTSGRPSYGESGSGTTANKWQEQKTPDSPGEAKNQEVTPAQTELSSLPQPIQTRPTYGEATPDPMPQKTQEYQPPARSEEKKPELKESEAPSNRTPGYEQTIRRPTYGMESSGPVQQKPEPSEIPDYKAEEKKTEATAIETKLNLLPGQANLTERPSYGLPATDTPVEQPPQQYKAPDSEVEKSGTKETQAGLGALPDQFKPTTGRPNYELLLPNASVPTPQQYTLPAHSIEQEKPQIKEEEARLTELSEQKPTEQPIYGEQLSNAISQPAGDYKTPEASSGVDSTTALKEEGGGNLTEESTPALTYHEVTPSSVPSPQEDKPPDTSSETKESEAISRQPQQAKFLRPSYEDALSALEKSVEPKASGWAYTPPEEIKPPEKTAPVESIPPPIPFNKPPEPKTSDLVFEPYHTVDYFASQGIKIPQEKSTEDKFGKQVKSFTDWLKTMKKLPATELNRIVPASTEHKVESLAEHSVLDADIVTETMAEVWVKQGNIEKAKQVYEKLSLLYPSKSAYFATKIQSLTEQK